MQTPKKESINNFSQMSVYINKFLTDKKNKSRSQIKKNSIPINTNNDRNPVNKIQNIIEKTRMEINSKDSISENRKNISKKDENVRENTQDQFKNVEKIEKIIKIKTNLKSNYLFHYAHFICDFMFPLVCGGLNKYSKIVRHKTLNQTIGNFDKLCREITSNKYEEMNDKEYSGCLAKEIELPLKETLKQKDFLYFQKFMWEKFVFGNTKYKDIKWPEVILIKRSVQKIINIEEFETKGMIYRKNNGTERREIVKVDKIEEELKKKYKDRFKAICLEDSTMESQVNLFYNAKLIIAAHGAALINLFFCKPKTIVVETIALPWYFFDTISSNLSLVHNKCENSYEKLKNIISTIQV